MISENQSLKYIYDKKLLICQTICLIERVIIFLIIIFLSYTATIFLSDVTQRLLTFSQRSDRAACWARVLVQVTMYRRLRIGRDGHLDQSEACDIS